jgi:dihydrofolate reductase
MGENRVIGRGNRLPWHLPADLARFKRLTLGKPILMGRRTWTSLPGLLPRRRHIVITRNPAFRAVGCEVVPSPQAALAAAAGEPEVMVIGGAQLYSAMLPMAGRLYLTLVKVRIEDGDAFFPKWDTDLWVETEREELSRDQRNAFDMSFITLERRYPPVGRDDGAMESSGRQGFSTPGQSKWTGTMGFFLRTRIAVRRPPHRQPLSRAQTLASAR